MAAITVQDGSAGWGANLAGFAAANGGGDTIAAGTTSAGGWQLPVVLLVRNADATPTDVTVAGTALHSVAATTGFSVIPVLKGQGGTTVAVTYSKVTSLTVAAVRLTSPLT